MNLIENQLRHAADGDRRIPGTVIVTARALAVLAEAGVEPSKCPYYPNTPRDGAACAAFWIPRAIASDFDFRRGDPATPHRLDISASLAARRAESDADAAELRARRAAARARGVR